MPEPDKPLPSSSSGLARGRGQARRFAMQAIYQWQMTGDDMAVIKRQYIADNNMDADNSTVDCGYYVELVDGVYSLHADIDSLLEKYMDRKIGNVDPVERAILRLATYEFLKRLDVPYKVVLNEAVNLGKKFCAEQSHTFINAVLDKLARELRSVETGLQAKP